MSAGLSSAFPTFLETTPSANESKTELQPFLKTTPIEPFLFTLSATTLLKSKTPDAVDTKVFISLVLSWVGVANCYDFLNHVYCKKKKTNEVPKHS